MGRILLAVNPSPSPGRTLLWTGKMKVTLIVLAALAITINGKPAPNAEPKAFFGAGLGAIALPALTNSALIDGLLLGKVAFLKAAILANLLLGSSSDESSDEAEYGAPAVDSHGAPAQEYAEPAPSYDAPAPAYEEPAPTYDAPAPAYDAPAPAYEEPVADTYGAPAADPLPRYFVSGPVGSAVSRLSAIVPGLITLFAFQPE